MSIRFAGDSDPRVDAFVRRRRADTEQIIPAMMKIILTGALIGIATILLLKVALTPLSVRKLKWSLSMILI